MWWECSVVFAELSALTVIVKITMASARNNENVDISIVP